MRSAGFARPPGQLRIEPDRVAVCGGSAGGYLTLMTGFAVNPRPKALVSYWGYGDIVGAWYSRPDPFYLRQPAVTREEALSAVGSAPVSEPPPKNNRGRFYLYCRQQGLWPKEVAGRDPATEDRWFSRYCPVRNVTREYPPTMLVHGTADTDVPYEQSKLMADRFGRGWSPASTGHGSRRRARHRQHRAGGARSHLSESRDVSDEESVTGDKLEHRRSWSKTFALRRNDCRLTLSVIRRRGWGTARCRQVKNDARQVREEVSPSTLVLVGRFLVGPRHQSTSRRAPVSEPVEGTRGAVAATGGREYNGASQSRRCGPLMEIRSSSISTCE